MRGFGPALICLWLSSLLFVAAETAAGSVGFAGKFDQTKLEIPSLCRSAGCQSLTGHSGLTLSFWFKSLTDPIVDSYCIAENLHDTGIEWRILLLDSKKLRFEANGVTLESSTLDLTTRHHVVISFDERAGFASITVDNVATTPIAVPPPAQYLDSLRPTSTSLVSLGQCSGTDTVPYHGLLDEFVVLGECFYCPTSPIVS